MLKCLRGAALSTVLSLGSSLALAQDPAISFDSATDTGADANVYVLGFEFSITTPILITHFGTHDFANNGLNFDHSVGIYDTADRSLLIDTIVRTTDTLKRGDTADSQYIYRALATPYELPAGTYRLVTTSQGEDRYIRGGLTGLDSASEITLGQGWYDGPVANSTTLEYPDSLNNNAEAPGTVYVNPNFLFTPVPEPSSMGILGILGAGLLARRRRTA